MMVNKAYEHIKCGYKLSLTKVVQIVHNEPLFIYEIKAE